MEIFSRIKSALVAVSGAALLLTMTYLKGKSEGKQAQKDEENKEKAQEKQASIEVMRKLNDKGQDFSRYSNDDINERLRKYRRD